MPFPMPPLFGDNLDFLRWLALAMAGLTSIAYPFMAEDGPINRRTLVKVGAVGGLIIWTLASHIHLPDTAQGIGIIVLLALVFSVLGDGLLARNTDKTFLYGLVAFLTGHVFYVVAMLFLADFSQLSGWQFGIAVALAVAALGMIAVLWKGAGSMRLPVAFYATTIAFMGISAVFSNAYGGWVILGAVLFMVSDSVIGIERFRKPFPGSRMTVWVTYMGAQYLLLFGLFHHLLQAG
ncbi:MAG: lysoplasmalogenase [Alphaproteobacteria bacterium]